jgi:hypothetical protein
MITPKILAVSFGAIASPLIVNGLVLVRSGRLVK